MSTSNTYDFISPKSRYIIDDAYERIGVSRESITGDQTRSAQTSLNFLLQSLPNKGKNLWTIRPGILSLNAGQNSYTLPDYVIDLKTVAVRTSNRNLSGEAFSSSGDAENAFDDDSDTACTQDAPDGNIGYTWESSTSVAMVGVLSHTIQDYTLVFEYSLDGDEFETALTVPESTYGPSTTSWFVIPAPVNSISFRVRETGGSTLDISELYFNTNVSDNVISSFSESEYNSIVLKNQTGKPSGYWVDRQIVPILRLWRTPDSLYKTLYFTYWSAIEDAGSLVDNLEIPARFLDAICAGLAYKLSIKSSNVSPEKMAILLADYNTLFQEATEEDRERVPLRIYPSYR